MKSRYLRRRPRLAFTLVELLVVVAIISLLAGLSTPYLTRAYQKAQSSKCGANLRLIGLAASQAATDNNNQYPEINQTAPPQPYPSSVPGLVGVLGPYGVTSNLVICPTDAGFGGKAACNNPSYGKSSYEWNPSFDDESTASPVIYITPGQPIPVNNGRVRLVMDFNNIHRGRPNAVYGDGHVTIH